MATAAVQLDEEALIKSFASEMTLPVGVKLTRVEPYVDWTGEEALMIVFTVSMRYPLTKKRVNALNAMKDEIQDKVVEAGIMKFPFARFLETK